MLKTKAFSGTPNWQKPIQRWCLRSGRNNEKKNLHFKHEKEKGKFQWNISAYSSFLLV
jgi:hypothetical protein